MKRLYFLILLCLLQFVLCAQKSLKTLITENDKCVFLVQCFNSNNQLISTGSGFFIHKTGIALTNVHVIKDAYKAQIKTIDGKVFPVEKVLDYDPSLDIVKIKVKSNSTVGYPAVKIAKKVASKGDEVFAIGSPFGLENTVSTGIISAIRSVSSYGECYQITAPISPGSSGGALFNMEGEVIGLTTFGQVDEGRLNQNLNFAVSIHNAKSLNKNQNITLETAYKESLFEGYVSAFLSARVSGNLNQAVEICTNQLRKKPQDWLAYHLRGNVFLVAGKYSEAENDFNKAIQYNPTNNLKDWDYIGLGKIYRRAGMFEQARDYYLKAVDINKSNPTTYCNLSVLAFDWLGAESPLVEASYKEALRLDPESCSFGWKKMGEKLMQQKNYEDAIKCFTIAIETEREQLLSLNEYFNRGTAYTYEKNYDNALADFELCLQLMPNDIQSYIMIGRIYVQQGKRLNACSSFKKAKEINGATSNDPEIGRMIQQELNTYCK